jgi:hypothetical protein
MLRIICTSISVIGAVVMDSSCCIGKSAHFATNQTTISTGQLNCRNRIYRMKEYCCNSCKRLQNLRILRL